MIKQPVLTTDQVDFFHRKGYLTVESLIDLAEVENLRVIFDELFASQAGREEGNQYDLAGTDEDGKQAALPQIVNPCKYAPQLVELSVRSRAAVLARQLLGADAEMQSDFAIMKPPHTEVETPWHQDEAFWAEDLDYNSLSIWIPLQDATPENGCLRYLPGNQNTKVVPHRPVGNDPRIHGLEIADLDDSKAVDCAVRAGGAVIHFCRTIHGAGGNHTDHPRRAYIVAFSTPPKKRVEPRDFYWKKLRDTARDRRRADAGTVSVSDGRKLAKK